MFFNEVNRHSKFNSNSNPTDRITVG